MKWKWNKGSGIRKKWNQSDKATCEEDILSYIAFPQQAEAFFEERENKKAVTFSYTIEEVK